MIKSEGPLKNMIAINLLPKNLRRSEKKIVISYQPYLILVFVFIVFLHLCLFSLGLVKKVQIIALKKNWSKVEPQSKNSALAKADIKKLQERFDSLKSLLSRKVSMAEILSGLSAAVPRGLWLERFSFSDGGLVIQGSVVSLNQSEMTTIGKFLQDLKNNKTFTSYFSKVELSSVQRRTIKTYDVVDFVIVGELKK